MKIINDSINQVTIGSLESGQLCQIKMNGDASEPKDTIFAIVMTRNPDTTNVHAVNVETGEELVVDRGIRVTPCDNAMLFPWGTRDAMTRS